MQAIILAAGQGSRLGEQLNGAPKALLKVGGVHLIDYQLAVLSFYNITDVCVVVGYQKNKLLRVIADRCTFVVNDRYAETNSLHSLWLTRNWVCEPFLLLNSDVLAHPLIFNRLMETPGSALVYDSNSGGDSEHMKVNVRDNRLRRISKTLPVESSHGESLGLLKFDAPAVKPLFREAGAALAQHGPKQWAPAAVNRLAQLLPITGLDISGMPWVEIDYPEDWLHAYLKIWPALDAVYTGLQSESVAHGAEPWSESGMAAGR